MSSIDCGFTLKHYREILEQARAAGYQFADFLQPPNGKPLLYLRHDVDVSPDNALGMAQVENQAGVISTFFVMCSSPFYNLLDTATFQIFQEIAKLGHRIGLHVDERLPSIRVNGDEAQVDGLEEQFEFLDGILPLHPVLSFHMPTPAVLNLDTGKYINAYSPPFFVDTKYLSDSRRRWREGCFCQWLGSDVLRSFQVLTHPVWWNEEELGYAQVHRLLSERSNRALAANLNSLADFELPVC